MARGGKKVLLYDLEVSPLRIRAFGEWQTDAIKVEQYSYVYCFSYKWLGESEVHTVALQDFSARYKDDPTDDYNVVKKLWDLRSQAQVTVAHNEDGFDRQVGNARFLVHDMGPPAPSRTVDTLKIARKHFKFSSNKLDRLGQQLKIGRKTEQGYGQLWEGYEANKEVSVKKMIEYCEQDVELLEKLYLRCMPFITNHPNMAMLVEDEDACPKCGHPYMDDISFYSTNTQTYVLSQCKQCKGWARYYKAEPERPKADYRNITHT